MLSVQYLVIGTKNGALHQTVAWFNADELHAALSKYVIEKQLDTHGAIAVEISMAVGGPHGQGPEHAG